jgi:protein subunit release factor B
MATPSRLEKPLPPRIRISESDLEEKFLKGSGPGGQKINKTSSAVQLKHLPTGLVVKNQETRSREQNRRNARRLLGEKLEEMEKGEQSRTALKAAKASKKKASASKKSRRKHRKLQEEKGEEKGDDEGEDEHEMEESSATTVTETVKGTGTGTGAGTAGEHEDAAAQPQHTDTPSKG